MAQKAFVPLSRITLASFTVRWSHLLDMASHFPADRKSICALSYLRIITGRGWWSWIWVAIDFIHFKSLVEWALVLDKVMEANITQGPNSMASWKSSWKSSRTSHQIEKNEFEHVSCSNLPSWGFSGFFLWCYWIGSQIRDHQPHSVHICLFVMPHGQKGRRFTEYCTWYSSSNWLRPFLFASLSSDQECMLLGTVGYRKHLKSMTLSVCPLCPCRCHPLKSLSQWLAENIWSIMDTIIQRFCA